MQLAAKVANNEVKSRRNQAKLIFQVLFITIFSIFFSLNYSKNVAIVSKSFIFSTFGIQTLPHFIKSLCVIKNSKNFLVVFYSLKCYKQSKRGVWRPRKINLNEYFSSECISFLARLEKSLKHPSNGS